MAEIIPLPAGARPGRMAPPTENGAQILFFLGVRYCRMEETEEPIGPARKPRGVDDSGKKRRRRARA
jgi:hypothetical protein